MSAALTCKSPACTIACSVLQWMNRFSLGPLTCQSTQLAYAGISFVRQKNTSECCISARAVNKRARRATHLVNVWRVSGRSWGSCESQISENVLLRVSSASVETLVHTASRYHRSVPSNYCFLLPKSSVCSLGRALGSRWWVFPLVWRGESPLPCPCCHDRDLKWREIVRSLLPPRSQSCTVPQGAY